jgi:hypothetical protein
MFDLLVKKINEFLYDEDSYHFEAHLACSEVGDDMSSGWHNLRRFKIKALLKKDEVGSIDLIEVEPNRYLVRNFVTSDYYPEVKKSLFRFISEFTGQELIASKNKEESP